MTIIIGKKDEIEDAVDKLADDIVVKLREIARIKAKIETSLDNKTDIRINERRMEMIEDGLAYIGALSKHIMVEQTSQLLDDCYNLDPDQKQIDHMYSEW